MHARKHTANANMQRFTFEWHDPQTGKTGEVWVAVEDVEEWAMADLCDEAAERAAQYVEDHHGLVDFELWLV